MERDMSASLVMSKLSLHMCQQSLKGSTDIDLLAKAAIMNPAIAIIRQSPTQPFI